MTTMAAARTAARDQVAHLEKRFGRKYVYLVGGGIALLLIVFFFRAFAFTAQRTPATSSPSRFGCEGDQQRRSSLFG